MAEYKMHILVCGGIGCKSSSSDPLAENLKTEITKQGLNEIVQVVKTGCFGFCENGPVVKIIPDNVLYTQVRPEDAAELIEEHLVKGKKVERLLFADPITREKISEISSMNFYKKQLRIALRNSGIIDPENIEEYIARGGYEALGKVLNTLTPEEAIEILKESGLRGRGGGGFPTGLKWDLTRKAESDVKYVVCNADEGDPGAFMDRSILKGDPHSVLEAMTINGYCTGASQGIIYIRAEYPLAIERLKTAIKQARDYGLLGNNILGNEFDFDIELRYGAGAFVCGEETALIHSMEGGRGEPIWILSICLMRILISHWVNQAVQQ